MATNVVPKVPVLLLLLQIHSAITVPLAEFYPFGDAVGDSKLSPNDDGSSGQIAISIQFPFFDNNHDSLYVSFEGFILIFNFNFSRWFNSHRLNPDKCKFRCAIFIYNFVTSSVYLPILSSLHPEFRLWLPKGRIKSSKIETPNNALALFPRNWISNWILIIKNCR